MSATRRWLVEGIQVRMPNLYLLIAYIESF